ncbi:transcription factor IIIB 90 kDa subunit-like [Planoprotostelium fungivorum]|uniref:Transcription factor IIIB 90 kDa subunit-like n=1 Tax=Planoprotostelium fungivorum TaxID=1890364 RepID=A0A2P6NK84_9EUKA|nr:transcription factor IIIB 90 kDa subunit-like [Planoprotostelium fungivorum]
MPNLNSHFITPFSELYFAHKRVTFWKFHCYPQFCQHKCYSPKTITIQSVVNYTKYILLLEQAWPRLFCTERSHQDLLGTLQLDGFELVLIPQQLDFAKGWMESLFLLLLIYSSYVGVIDIKSSYLNLNLFLSRQFRRSETTFRKMVNPDDCEHPSGDIETDFHTGAKICGRCGNVMEDAGATDTSGSIDYTARSSNYYQRSSAPANVKNNDQAKGNCVRRCQTLASRLRLGQKSQQTVLGNMHRYMSGKYSGGKKGDLIIAACIFITCRQDSQPVTLLDISRIVQYNVFEVGRYYIRVKRKLGIELEEADPRMYIEHLLGNNGVNIDAAKRPIVLRQALEILDAIKEIEVGRRPNIVIGAVVMLACQTHSVYMDKETVAEFVHSNANTVSLRLKEIKGYFVTFSKFLPFGDHTSKKTIHNLVPDILRHQKLIKKCLEDARSREDDPWVEKEESKHMNETEMKQDKLWQERWKEYNTRLTHPVINRHNETKEHRRQKVEKMKRIRDKIMSGSEPPRKRVKTQERRDDDDDDDGEESDEDEEDEEYVESEEEEDSPVEGSPLDAEDYMTLRMLLEGYTEHQIINGAVLGVHKTEEELKRIAAHPNLGDTELNDNDLREEEVDQYLKTDEESQLTKVMMIFEHNKQKKGKE